MIRIAFVVFVLVTQTSTGMSQGVGLADVARGERERRKQLGASKGPLVEKVTQAGQATPPIPVLSPAQLDSLVAPIALYPDPLLSQVLVASTYPLEIVEAVQWLQQNPRLADVALQDAARQQNWDPSIQALVIFPDVLQRLSGNIRWTVDLGSAFLAQQTGVMDAVQRMRNQAIASANLTSNAQTVVTAQPQGATTIVEIQPANPEVIYVPVYDPVAVWGPPAFYPYPVLSYARVPVTVGPELISFTSRVHARSLFTGWGGWGEWGWRPNWYGRTVVVNNSTAIWMQDSVHRAKVPYSNRELASQFHDNFRGSIAGRPQTVVRSAGPVPNVFRPASSGFVPAAPAPTVSRPVANSFSNRPGTLHVARNNFNRGRNFSSEAVRASNPLAVQNFRSSPSPAPQRAQGHFRSEAPRGHASGARSAARGDRRK